MAGLPDEITGDILFCLPARSLVPFTCVRRTWNSLLTSSTSFIEAYRDRCSKFGDKYFLKYDRNDYTQLEIFLWNPSTDERRRLPRPRYFVSKVIGFGSVSLTSSGGLVNFKVVNIRIEWGLFTGRCLQLEAYSLRRSPWKRIGNGFPCGIDHKCSGNQVVFRNFACWSSYQYDASPIPFDLVEEAFHRMVLPLSMRSLTEQICLLDGCLGTSRRAIAMSCGS
ncbi:hypothetical protein ACJRO7_003281 [Eucalyptus globulus]|uniref:F-box domain-containing protein n=1 Tax=Eucalyptus globulus TaxID=34317 RepID=A0ABD3IWG5_EUCGL